MLIETINGLIYILLMISAYSECAGWCGANDRFGYHAYKLDDESRVKLVYVLGQWAD